jgi:hypothetical protein
MSAGLRLTLADLIRDKVFSLTLLLGVTVSEYLKGQLPGASTPEGSGVALLEMALIGCAVGYLLRATKVLALQVSIVTEHGAISGSWSRWTARFLSGSTWVLRSLRTVLWAALAALVLTTLGIVLSTALGALGIDLFDDSTSAARSMISLPIESAILIATVVSLIVGTWLVRGTSYLLQARCQTILG